MADPGKAPPSSAMTVDADMNRVPTTPQEARARIRVLLGKLEKASPFESLKLAQDVKVHVSTLTALEDSTSR